MRTPEQAAEDLIARGRTPEQIRAIAIARNDEALRKIADFLMDKKG
jgi:hypothetical protein